MRLELDEVRRLTGPNLLWDEPGAILDVFIDHPDKLSVIACWQQWMDRILDKFQWQQSHVYRLHSEGASMALSAPMDALYTACDLAELAWDCCVAQCSDQALPDWQARLNELQIQLEQEANPALIALLEAANAKAVTAICDDDEFSLGMGNSVRVWPVDSLPTAEAIDWQMFHDIPTAFVTGTNGKSTSVRLAAEIAEAAGYTAGVTSTDFIRVGDDIIDEGDYSGPGGARMLLRDTRTQIGFLEVARGGILRRGLPIQKVKAALITNIARDHLGQYGIYSVEELAEVKFVVAKGVHEDGTLVLNADNDHVVNQAKHVGCQICWFSLDEHHPLVAANIEKGLPAVFVRDQQIVYQCGAQPEVVASLSDVPMTLNGAAKHNVQNALGVVGLCKALYLPTDAMQKGLASFASDPADNPGRGNLYEVEGARVMVDFAHNEHSMRAVVETAKQLQAKRYIVMFSNAGDRSDDEIRKLTQAIRKLDANLYIIAEIEKYLRGREIGVLPALAKSQLVADDVDEAKIRCVGSPLEGASLALESAQPGDCLLLFVLAQRKEVHDLLTLKKG